MRSSKEALGQETVFVYLRAVIICCVLTVIGCESQAVCKYRLQAARVRHNYLTVVRSAGRSDSTDIDAVIELRSGFIVTSDKTGEVVRAALDSTVVQAVVDVELFAVTVTDKTADVLFATCINGCAVYAVIHVQRRIAESVGAAVTYKTTGASSAGFNIDAVGYENAFYVGCTTGKLTDNRADFTAGTAFIIRIRYNEILYGRRASYTG